MIKMFARALRLPWVAMQLVSQYQTLPGQECGRMALTVRNYKLCMGIMSLEIKAEAPMEHTAVQLTMEWVILLMRQWR